MRWRPRANAPAFIGAPIPHRCRGEGDRASRITMIYCDPWTLRSDEADACVPYEGANRPHDMPWEEAMTAWLDGNATSKESARYVAHCLSVFRVRPRDDVEDVRSDEDVGDKEVIVAPADSNTSYGNAYWWTRVRNFSGETRMKRVDVRMLIILVWE